jgi:alkaline phosphatase
MDIPKDLADDATNAAKRIWEKKIDEFVKRELYFDENMQTLYSLIWGQCSDVMQARVEASSDYDKMSESGDSLALLKAIKAQAYNFQSQKNKANALHDAKRQLLMLYQDRHTTCPVYLDRFQNCVDVLEHCGGAISPDPALVEQILARSDNTTATAATDELNAAKEGAIEEYLAMAFIQGADRNQFG